MTVFKPMSLRLFIEQVINQEIDEMAVAPEQATQANLALFVEKRGSDTDIILYKPDVFEEACRLKSKGMHAMMIYRQAQPVVGAIFIEFKSKCNAWESTATAAEKGYGPLMYDIALSYTGPTGVMSDRSSVSQAARKVWQYYFTKRRNDIEVEPLEEPVCQFKGSDSEEFLNYKFKLKNPVNITQLEQNHAQVIKKLEARFQEVNVQDFLSEMGSKFFSVKYTETPNS